MTRRYLDQVKVLNRKMNFILFPYLKLPFCLLSLLPSPVLPFASNAFRLFCVWPYLASCVSFPYFASHYFHFEVFCCLLHFYSLFFWNASNPFAWVHIRIQTFMQATWQRLSQIHRLRSSSLRTHPQARISTLPTTTEVTVVGDTKN